MPVSFFGNPVDYDRLARIKEKYNLYIVEDAACSIGTNYKLSNIVSAVSLVQMRHIDKTFVQKNHYCPAVL